MYSVIYDHKGTAEKEQEICLEMYKLWNVTCTL